MAGRRGSSWGSPPGGQGKGKVFEGSQAKQPCFHMSAAALLAGTGLEGEALAVRVALGGRGVAGQAAQIDKVLLSGGALFEGDVAPFVDEGLGGEGRLHG